MPASLKKIRQVMQVEPTEQDKGLHLTLRISAYDNGLITVDKVPMHGMPSHSSETAAWLDAVTTAMITIEEFRRQVEARRTQQDSIVLHETPGGNQLIFHPHGSGPFRE